MQTVRMNITIPLPLARELKEISAPRKRSQVVSDAISEKIEQCKKQQLDKLLIAGYQATRDEGIALTKEFDHIDIEGWDEY